MLKKGLELLSTVTIVCAILYFILGFIEPDKTISLLYRANGGTSLIIAVLVIPKIIQDLEG